MNQPTNRNARGSALTNLIGGIAILLVTLYFLVKLAGSGYDPGTVEQTTPAAIQTRIQPQGSVVEGKAAEKPKEEAKAETASEPAADAGAGAGGAAEIDIMATGKKVFDGLCFGCHAANSAIPDTPRITNKADWAPRIKKGQETLFKHAIEGFTDKGMMPAKGGNTALSDDEVKAAVTYMVNESGGNFPASNKAAGDAAAPAADAKEAKADEAKKEEPKKEEAKKEEAKKDDAAGGAEVMAAGKKVFDGLCFGCHAANSAIPDTPRITNKADWAPRIKKGQETLFKHAIEGFTDKGMMPAKGGNTALSDDEVKAAVVYMVNESGGKF